jgi:hypothetical protein
MEPVFIHRRFDGWDLGDLMPERFGVVAVQRLTTPAARLRLAVDDMPELLRRDQGSGVPAMTGLPTGLLSRGGSRGTAFDRGRIGGRGPGGVGGVLVEAFLQFSDALLEGLHQRRDRRLSFGCERIPDGLWERWLVLHAAVVPAS